MNTWEDAHARSAALMLGKDPDRVTARERTMGKDMNAAVALNTTNYEVARRLDITLEEASALRDCFSSKVLGITPPRAIIGPDEVSRLAGEE